MPRGSYAATNPPAIKALPGFRTSCGGTDVPFRAKYYWATVKPGAWPSASAAASDLDCDTKEVVDKWTSGALRADHVFMSKGFSGNVLATQSGVEVHGRYASTRASCPQPVPQPFPHSPLPSAHPLPALPRRRYVTVVAHLYEPVRNSKLASHTFGVEALADMGPYAGHVCLQKVRFHTAAPTAASTAASTAAPTAAPTAPSQTLSP